MLTQEEITSLDEILSSHDYDSSSVIAVMQDIQKKYRYLPEDALSYIAGKLKLSEAKIYGVATFYENFSLEPKGRHVIKVCDGTACHVRKSIPILEEFRNILGLSETKHNSDDMLFTLETVSCLGACGLAPVCTVNDKVHAAMTPEKARELIKELMEEAANENYQPRRIKPLAGILQQPSERTEKKNSGMRRHRLCRRRLPSDI